MSIGTRLVTSIVLLVVVTVMLTSSPGLAQTAQLSRSAHTVSEVSGHVTIEITLSDPATEWGGVFLQTKDGDALAGQDYEETTAWVEWLEGEDESRHMIIPILDDADVETDHTFEVEIVYGNGISVGSLSTAAVTILDNDGTGDPVAFIDPMGATENPQGGITFFGPSGASIDVTVRLDRIPSQPYQVDFTSDFDPTSGRLTFDGTDEQTVTVNLPAGHDDIVEGVFALVAGGQPGVAKGLNFLMTLLSSGRFTFQDCLVCMFFLYTSVSGLADCPVLCSIAGLCPEPRKSAAAATTTVEILRRYRDEVLTSTETGQFYIDFFDEHQAALTDALVRRPTFIHRVFSAQASWVNAIGALVDGNGATAFITFQMRDDLLALLDELQDLADADTAAALQRQRTQLQLDSIASMSMVQFQSRIETLGGLPTEASSWGRVKAKY